MKIEIRITDWKNSYDAVFTSDENVSKEDAIKIAMKAIDLIPERENHLDFKDVE